MGWRATLVTRAVLIWLLAGLFAALNAQETAAIQGVVTDSSGAVIPGAAVTVTSLDRGVQRTVRANEVGFYSVPLLSPGPYKVECSSPGFAAKVHPLVRLEVGLVARIDCELAVGAVAETVEISAAATLLQSEKTEVGQVIDNKRIVEMPLNGRNYLELAQLTVGVLPARQLGRGYRGGQEGGFTAVGAHGAQNTILLDGTDNTSVTSGGALGWEAQAVKPAVDAVAEFKVVTNNTSAEFGYRTGAKVLVTTRSGTNELHGSLYHFLRNDRLDGANFFANRAGAAKPPYRQNQFGGTLGGPLIRNRTFYFGSYQGTRIRLGESNISTVPSMELRNGDTSKQPAIRRNIFDPYSIRGSGADAVRQPFPGNVVPRNLWDPVAAPIVQMYPLPNIAGRENDINNYFFSASQKDDADQYDFRVDHNFSDAHRFYARYSVRNQNKVDPGPLPLPADGGQWTTTRLDGDNVGANLGSTLSPRLFNELRFGFTHFPTRLDIPYKENLNKKLGILGAPGDTFGDKLDHGWTRFSPSGYAEIGARSFWPNVNNVDTLTAADSLLWQKGHQSIKVGGEYRRINVFREAQRFRRGQFGFSGVYTAEKPEVATSRANTGNGIADFLLGMASSAQYGNAQGENIIVPYWAFFVQDDWKIRPSLTINLGLRYEVFKRPHFPHPEKQSVGRWLIPEVNGIPPEKEGMDFPKDGRDTGGRTDWNNLAPRLGIAWRLGNRTVIRAGAGLYYGFEDYLSNESANFRTGPPKSNEIVVNPPRTNPTLRVKDGFPPFYTGVIPDGVSVTVTPYFRPMLYSGQWFFDLQQELPWDALLTIGYNGQSSSHLATELNINQPLTPHPTIRWQDRRIRPRFTNVSLLQNILNSNYNSLTVKVEKRYSRGLTLLSSFTWSHSIDYADEALFEGGSGRASPYELWRDRASSSLDRRLAWVTSFVWELPLGRGRRWLAAGPASWALGGWNVGAIVSLLAGLPVDHTFNVDNQNNGGRVRGDWVRNPELPASERNIDRWFDTGFLRASPPGVMSNAGRNLIVAPGRNNLDFIASKNFPFGREGRYLQFRFEAFNFTNTPHFGVPNTSVGTPNAGRITTADQPRRIQFGLKWVF
jgi:hypothetical protein